MGIEKILNKYYKGGSGPKKVWANTKLDELRRSECLCINCDRANDSPPYSSCGVAGELYRICQKDGMAVAITRCGATDKEGNLMYVPKKEINKK